MRKVAFFFISIYILLILVNRFSTYIIEDHTSYEYFNNIKVPLRGFFLPWINFDGKNYLTIATQGYENNQVLSVFFPFYPLLIRVLSVNLYLNPVIVGIFISVISSFIACFILYKLIKLEFSDRVAKRSLLLLLIFPTSFFFFSYYTEGLYLLLSSLVFWALKKKNLTLASIFTLLSTATRLIGLAIVPVLVYEGYKVYKKQKKISWIITLSPLGFILYAVYNYLSFGNLFLMFSSQTSERFGRSLTLFSPLIVFKDAIQKVFAGPKPEYDNIFVYPVIVLEFLFAIFSLIILFLIYKLLPKRYFIYSFFSILLILLSSALASNLRYLLLIFPIFIALTLYLSKKYFLLWSIISFFLLIFASSLFLRNYWIS